MLLKTKRWHKYNKIFHCIYKCYGFLLIDVFAWVRACTDYIFITCERYGKGRTPPNLWSLLFILTRISVWTLLKRKGTTQSLVPHLQCASSMGRERYRSGSYFEIMCIEKRRSLFHSSLLLYILYIWHPKRKVSYVVWIHTIPSSCILLT